MSKGISERFCLRKGRRNFGINPHDDPEFFFGRKEIHQEVMDRIRKDIALFVPIKLVVNGDYGTGKTHLLRHIEYVIGRDKLSVKAIYLDIGDISKKSMFSSLFRLIMRSIGSDEVLRLLVALEDRSANLAELWDSLDEIAGEQSGSKNIARMMRNIITQKDNRDQFINMWRWFIGDQLSAAILNSFNVAEGLTELGDYISVLMTIGRLYSKVDGNQLLILVDEAEKLRQVTDQDALSNWTNALREIFDDDNHSVGFAFALGAGSLDTGEVPVFEERAVRSRLSGRIISLELLGRDDMEEFVKDLVKEFTRASCVDKIVADNKDTTKDTYPFTKNAWNEFVAYITEDPGLSKPRIAIKALNEYVAEAHLSGKQLIDADVIQAAPRPTE
ncbi:MAG: hypothetical protein ACFFER_16065 [Candidatus Thorarchaeota archaeon]